MKTEAILISLLFVTYSCTKDNAKLPTVTTSPITEVTWEYALTGGDVINDGGSPVIVRGVCATEYKFDPPSLNADFETWHTSDSSGIGSFTSKIDIHWHGAALSIRDTTYVRAYATNNIGTAYGEVLSFFPKSKLPTSESIKLESVTATSTTALVNYQIDVIPRYTIDERGICYNTNSNPTVEGDHILITDGNTAYSSITIENLTPNTTYFVRGYTKNESGIYYTSEISFTTE